MTENTVATREQQNGVTTAVQEDTHEPSRFVTPAVDIYENGDGLVVVADMPGLDKEDIDISIEKDVLTIRGATRQEVEQVWAYNEFERVGYFRQFRVSNKINQTNIQAEYKHGVLTLRLPFAEEQKPRQIDIKVG